MANFNTPPRICENFDGVYYLPESGITREVTFETVISTLHELPTCIIKPARVYSGGVGVQLIEVKNGIEIHSQKIIAEYLQDYTLQFGSAWCIECKIEECDNLKKLNPSSCNTLRVHTYRSRKDQRVKCASAYIRIGRKGNVVDNAHSGGICGKIYEGGVLHGAVSCYPYREYRYTDSGVDLEGYLIDNYDKIVNTVVNAHETLPMFDLMGWDVAIDSSGRVIIIEFNPNPDMKLEQCIFGFSCLQDSQEEVIRQVYRIKTDEKKY